MKAEKTPAPIAIGGGECSIAINAHAAIPAIVALPMLIIITVVIRHILSVRWGSKGPQLITHQG